MKRSPIVRKKRICEGCGDEKFIFSHGLCEGCAKPTYGPINKRRKKTGELLLFEKLWEQRPHYCSVCQKPIYKFSHNNFAHILSKGAYPSLRLDPDNIEIMCHSKTGQGCHNRYDTKAKSDLIEPMWTWIFEKAERLKTKYYANLNKTVNYIKKLSEITLYKNN